MSKNTVKSLKETYEDQNSIFWYWCNACNDINIPGAPPMECGSVEKLPVEARDLYEAFWAEDDYRHSCYVVQYNAQFGIALGILLDNNYVLEDLPDRNPEIEALGLKQDFLLQVRTAAGKMTAQNLSDALPDATVFFGEGTDPDGDEILVFFPKEKLPDRNALTVLADQIAEKDGYPFFEEAFKALATGAMAPVLDAMYANLTKMIEGNATNVKVSGGKGYEGGYAHGYHDAIVEVMNLLQINRNDEEFFN